MKLHEYFAEKKKECIDWKQRDFAQKLGVHESHLSAITRGRVTPCPMLALEIERETGGQVSGWELMINSLNKRGKTKRKKKNDNREEE